MNGQTFRVLLRRRYDSIRELAFARKAAVRVEGLEEEVRRTDRMILEALNERGLFCGVQPPSTILLDTLTEIALSPGVSS